MFKCRPSAIVAAVLFSSFISCNALAQVYAGGGIGSSNANVDCTGVTGCKISSVSETVFAGYGFTPNWIIEGGYINLNKIAGTATGTYNQQAVTADYTARSTAIDLSAVYRTDFERGWAVFAKLGLSRIKTADTLNGTVGSVVAPATSVSNDSTSPVFGLGVDYKVTANTLVYLSVDRRRVKAYDANGIDLKFNVTNFGLGAQYSF